LVLRNNPFVRLNKIGLRKLMMTKIQKFASMFKSFRECRNIFLDNKNSRLQEEKSRIDSKDSIRIF